jgi:hypothetical protein
MPGLVRSSLAASYGEVDERREQQPEGRKEMAF